jgi:hypothetical protein
LNAITVSDSMTTSPSLAARSTIGAAAVPDRLIRIGSPDRRYWPGWTWITSPGAASATAAASACSDATGRSVPAGTSPERSAAAPSDAGSATGPATASRSACVRRRAVALATVPSTGNPLIAGRRNAPAHSRGVRSIRHSTTLPATAPSTARLATSQSSRRASDRFFRRTAWFIPGW